MHCSENKSITVMAAILKIIKLRNKTYMYLKEPTEFLTSPSSQKMLFSKKKMNYEHVIILHMGQP